MIYTTLNKIREHSPCKDGWEKLLSHLGKTKADDEPLQLVTVLDSNGLADALWCCRAIPEHDQEWRLFAVWCARHVQHLMTDERSLNALDVAESYASGEATEEELAAALDASRAASGDASGAAAWAAARAASGDASGAAAWATAGGASEAAACAAARAASGDASGAASWATAWAAAWAASGVAQEKEFRRIITGEQQ